LSAFYKWTWPILNKTTICFNYTIIGNHIIKFTCVTIDETSEVLLGIITVFVDLASFPKASTYDSATLRDAAL